MLIIGLTGNIGSGKSLAAAYLKELGAGIIDADLIARRVVEPESPALNEIIKAFGKEYLNEDGTLNRKKLGKLVFSSPESLSILNGITHPKIKAAIEKEISEFKKQGKAAAVIEAAILLEAGFESSADLIWLVVAEKEDILKRLAIRDGLSSKEALARLAAQAPPESLMAKADILIYNNGSKDYLFRQIQTAYSRALNYSTQNKDKT